MFDIGVDNLVILKNPEILLVKEFKTLWDTDKSKGKEAVMKLFAYIYFKHDFKSPYRKSYAQEEITDILKKDLQFESSWKPTEHIQAAEKKYVELQTSKSLKAIISAETALEQITDYFNTFKLNDLEIEDRADAIKKLMDNLKNLDDVVAKLSAARERVEKELESKKLAGTKILTSRELPKSKRK